MNSKTNGMKQNTINIRRRMGIMPFTAVALMVLVMLGSCELERSRNKKLDGYWRLQQIDTIGTGGVNTMQGKRMFWAIQHKLLELRDIDGNVAKCLLRFEKQGDSLMLSQPYLYDRENGDKPLTNTEILQHYGVNRLNEHFRIDNLTSSRMVLSSRKCRLHFVKF